MHAWPVWQHTTMFEAHRRDLGIEVVGGWVGGGALLASIHSLMQASLQINSVMQALMGWACIFGVVFFRKMHSFCCNALDMSCMRWMSKCPTPGPCWPSTCWISACSANSHSTLACLATSHQLQSHIFISTVCIYARMVFWLLAWAWCALDARTSLLAEYEWSCTVVANE